MHSTLVESLLAAAKTDKGIIFVTSEKDEDILLYSVLLNNAKCILNRLREMNVEKGDEVVFQFWSLKNFICTYWACLLGGYVPVPLALSKQADGAQKLFNIWKQLDNPWLITDENKTLPLLASHAEPNSDDANLWKSSIATRSLTPSFETFENIPNIELPVVDEEDIAFIQFSSGSTGTPKGVVLTHANLLANINDLLGAVEINGNDVFLSWKPISHDFGMIAFHIAPVVAAVPQVRIPMETYLWSPVIWFQMVHKYRATILGSPNFGYRHFLKFYKRRSAKAFNWDLSCVKTIINGAESISASLCHEFLNEMEQYGLRAESMRPGYGLAEASLVVSLSNLGDGVREISVHREKMNMGEKVEILDAQNEHAVQLVDCGPIFPSTEVRITNAEREVLNDGVIGQIEIRGANVTSGYYNNADATAKAIDKDGWVNTEDLGFINNGRLVFATRIKEMIILGGVNYFPHDIEKSILRIKGDEALNHYVACSIPSTCGESEQLAVFVYYKKNIADFKEISDEISEIVADSFGIKVDIVLPVRSIPKTTSGKVQRYVLKNQYLTGEFDDTLRALGIAPRHSLVKAMPIQSPTLTAIKEQLDAIVRAECKQSTVSYSESFFNLGVSSLRLLTLRDTIESSFGIELDVTQILDNPNINAIATLIESTTNPSTLTDKNSPHTEPFENQASAKDEAIAIVGMACRFPGNVHTPEEYWALLSNSVDPVSEMPASRWGQVQNNKLVTRQVGYLEDIDLFDPYFFGITPSEAESMDPQQRLLLEICHQALENSGVRVPDIKGSRTGVFVGISGTEYAGIGRELGNATSTYTYTGTMFNTAAGRIAYTFGLQGPCVSLDTACSSSLTAVHLGSNELKANSCDRVIAAAVGLMLTSDGHICFSQMNALSPSGRSRSFDDGADGYIRSEGCAAVVLKRLSDAQRDGDNVLAVIRGSAINHNGQSGGLTVPSGHAQEALIKTALQNAQVNPQSVDYVEAHGSGTKLGDPQEVSALNRVFNNRTRPLYLGSVKSNLGHLEAVAGLAGLQKVVLSLQHGKIPANLHFSRPNQLIDWTNSPLKVVDKLTPFSAQQPFRFAGISSLGINGSNAHLVLEAPTRNIATTGYAEKQLQQERDAYLVTLSAPSEASLKATIENFVKADLSDMSVNSLSRATQFQRSHYSVRYATLVSDIPALKAKLSRRLERDQNAVLSKLTREVTQPRTVFMFTGQGSQYVGMARELYQEFDYFKTLLDQCSTLFSRELGVSIVDTLFGAQANGLDDVAVSQATIFSVEYTLAKLWQHLGAEPDVVMGHSIGEYAAACFSNVMSLNDAVKMVLARGRVMKSAPAGAMLGVLAEEARVVDLIGDTSNLYVAAVNAPSNVTVAGSTEAMTEFRAKLKKAKIFTEPLAIKQPFHSPLMAPVVSELRTALSSVSIKQPNRLFISTQLGDAVTSTTPLDSEYWCQHLCQPVQFMQAIKHVAKEERPTCFIEIGGTATLSGLASQVLDSPQFMFLPSLREGRNAWLQFNESLAQAYMAGIEFDWSAYHACDETFLQGLPNTGFGRERYWFKDKGKQVAASSCALSAASQPEQVQVAIASTTTLPEVVDEVYILVELVSTISQVTGVAEDQLQQDTNLFSLGVDSLMLVQLDKRIQSRFNVEISLAQFFSEMHTPEKLSRYIDNNLSDASRKSLKHPPEEIQNSTTPLAQLNSNESSNSSLLLSMEKQLQTIQQQLVSLGANSPNRAVTIEPAVKAVAQRQYSRDIVLVEDELSTNQKAFVESLTRELNTATPTSKSYAEEHRSEFADWIATLNFTLTTKEFTYPLVAERSSGARFWDVDGNEYIDTAMGYGVCLFGHNPPFVTNAIQNQLALGMELGPQNKLAGKVASLVCELTGVERVAFANTGSEAVMVAIRLARAVSKRDKIVRFVTSFHGSFDGILAEMGEDGSEPMAAGIASSMVQDTLVMQYGSDQSLESIANQAGDIAAVLVEPVQSRNPGLQPKEYLKQLRKITEQYGIALIFDEMITGFRVHPGGAQAHFGVAADIVTYGKIVGGGLPIGVLGGKKIYMDAIDGGEWKFGDNTGPSKETTFFAGTFCKHPLTMAAALAVLTKIRDDGPALQQTLNKVTQDFSERLNNLFSRKQVPITVKYFSSMYRLESGAAMDMPRHSLEMNLFFKLLQLQGIYVWERRTCFISTVHSDIELDAIYTAIETAIDKLREGGFSFRRADSAVENSKPRHAVSSEESRMYVLSQMQGGDLAYRISGALRISGTLHRERLQQAFNMLCDRHPILLSTYCINNGVIQRVEQDRSFIPAIEWTNSDHDSLNANAEPFDLAEGPLWYAKVIEKSELEHVLIFELHHIIADGTSISNLVEELFLIYNNQELSAPSAPYNKFVEQEIEYLKTDRFTDHLDYWKKQFKTIPEPLQLPSDRARGALNDFAGASTHFTLDTALTKSVHAAAKSMRTTPFITLLAGWFTWLSTVSQQKDLCVGIPFDRRGSQFDRTVGMFAQTLAIRNEVTAESSFADLVEKLSSLCSDAFTYSDVPLDRIIDSLDVQRDLSRNPLFDCMFIYESGSRRYQDMDGLSIEPIQMKSNASAFDLTVELTEQAGVIQGQMIYAKRLFDAARIDQWSHSFVDFLRKAIEQPKQSICKLGGLTDKEVQLVDSFHGKKLAVAQTSAIDAFVDIAHSIPACEALRAVDRTLTYQELLNEVDKLAAYLIEKGVKPGDAVAILLMRDSHLIVSILAVLRCGACYIPLDPEYPNQRLQYMIDHAKVTLTISKESILEGLNFSGDIVDPTQFLCSEDDIAFPKISPDHIAYIIYTSGSTGTPKGVMLQHSNLSYFIAGISDAVDFPEDAVTLGLTTVSFDIFVLEVFVTLSQLGGCLVLASEQEQLDPSACSKRIVEDKVNVVQMTPSRLRALLTSQETNAVFADVETLIVGGEAFPAEHLSALQTLPQLKVFNVYGPTEATVWATCANLSSRSDVTIGRPLANVNAYILDANLQRLPIGHQGELYLAGQFLAKGYLFDEDKTAEVFIDNPFANGERIYRTGDLASWSSSGELLHHGRRDHQVKLRGYRIELPEIEKALSDIDEVSQSAVVLRELSENNPVLVAFCTTSTDLTEEDFSRQVRSKLKDVLPSFMQPSVVCLLPTLPLTPNGKIDRNRLPTTINVVAPQSKNSVNDVIEDKLEIDILTIWKRLLGERAISRYDSFFDVGGSSFSLLLLQAEFNKQWPGLVQVPDLFAHPNIKAQRDFIASRMQGQNIADYRSLEVSEEFWDTTSNQSNQGTLVIENDAELSKVLNEHATSKSLKVHDLLIGLFSVYLNKRLATPMVSVYFAAESSRGYHPIEIDFGNANNLDDVFQTVHTAMLSPDRILTPPSIEDHTGALILFKSKTQVLNSRHRRFHLQVSLNSELNNPLEPLLQIDFDATKINQNVVRGWVNDYLRLAKALLSPSHKRISA
ncbi:amino acid adenylation domain-containing protein [Saccharophagus degradans]|uniref:non-ribosomal peptide synthetase/type I polyketide synthase n=1 Tax=Saccharophagus degradans TaxID=86304 RepID=UPI001C0852F6|nr:non-ribosomal peptide synthetase/type I polyketide synthase [Saccharophagus degradans]MBU2985630.1 amino acid adenylation domain-containing protein [Saccharophagus degradans]